MLDGLSQESKRGRKRDTRRFLPLFLMLPAPLQTLALLLTQFAAKDFTDS